MSGDHQRRYLGGQAWGFDEHFEGARFHCRHFAGSLKGVLLNAWRERVNEKCTTTEVEYLGPTHCHACWCSPSSHALLSFFILRGFMLGNLKRSATGGLSLEGGGLGCSDD